MSAPMCRKNQKTFQDRNTVAMEGEQHDTNVEETLNKDDQEKTVVTSNVKSEEEEGEQCDGDLVLSHQEVMIKVQSTLADIISSDPLLYDLPPQVTLEEINSYIALEYGQAMVVNVRRADNEVLPIVVTQNATVLDLKHAIKRHVNLKQQRANGKLNLSWRYVWKRYWLYYTGEKLMDDKKLLKDYGIRNKEEVTFIKRLKERGKHRR